MLGHASNPLYSTFSAMTHNSLRQQAPIMLLAGGLVNYFHGIKKIDSWNPGTISKIWITVNALYLAEVERHWKLFIETMTHHWCISLNFAHFLVQLYFCCTIVYLSEYIILFVIDWYHKLNVGTVLHRVWATSLFYSWLELKTQSWYSEGLKPRALNTTHSSRQGT